MCPYSTQALLTMPFYPITPSHPQWTRNDGEKAAHSKGIFGFNFLPRALGRGVRLLCVSCMLTQTRQQGNKWPYCMLPMPLLPKGAICLSLIVALSSFDAPSHGVLITLPNGSKWLCTAMADAPLCGFFVTSMPNAVFTKNAS